LAQVAPAAPSRGAVMAAPVVGLPAGRMEAAPPETMAMTATTMATSQPEDEAPPHHLLLQDRRHLCV
jgi:hypothetical protein